MQGFVSFTGSTEPDVLDVDKLNERLAVKGRLRLRHAMKPDEGFGMVFSFDGVVCDTQRLRKRAWEEVAQQRGALQALGPWQHACHVGSILFLQVAAHSLLCMTHACSLSHAGSKLLHAAKAVTSLMQGADVLQRRCEP